MTTGWSCLPLSSVRLQASRHSTFTRTHAIVRAASGSAGFSSPALPRVPAFGRPISWRCSPSRRACQQLTTLPCHRGGLPHCRTGETFMAASRRRGGHRGGHRHHALHRHVGLADDRNRQLGSRTRAGLDHSGRGVQCCRSPYLPPALAPSADRRHRAAHDCYLRFALHRHGCGNHHARPDPSLFIRPSWTMPRWRSPLLALRCW
jgi:hypothetical protein